MNKVSTKVELHFALETSTAINAETKVRLRAQCASRLGANGDLVVTSQRTRDQIRNLEDARTKLSELILRSLYVAPKRRDTKPTRSSVRRRLDSKKSRSDIKKSRSFRDE